MVEPPRAIAPLTDGADARRARRPSTAARTRRRLSAATVSGAVVLGLALNGCSTGTSATPTRPDQPIGSSAPLRHPHVPPVTAPPPPGSQRRPAVIITGHRNLPDPFVLKVPGGYQLYASQTNFDTAAIPTAFSPTFGKWGATHSALAKVPSWAVNGFIWAPDVRRIAGKYVLYFDSLVQPSIYDDRRQSGFGRFAQCIGTAVGRRHGGPFIGSERPLICDFKAHGAIDPRTFVGPDGQLWLDWKSDDNAATPNPYPPTKIYAEKLSASGLALAGPPHLLLRAGASWQQNIVEAPDMVLTRGRYWLFYSGSWFNQSSYGIGVAACHGPLGPCRDLSRKGPWLGSNAQGGGPGEESVFEGSKGDWWILYSPWAFDWNGTRFRPIAIAPLAFRATGPYVAVRPRGTRLG